MSLYDGLGVDLAVGPKKEKTNDGKKSDVSGWSAGIRMMQSQLRLKKAALTEAQRKIRSATLAPVVDLKGQSIGLVEEGMAVSPPVAPSFTPSKHSQPIFTGDRIDVIRSDIGNEYDPAYPNEYEKVVKKMREKRQKERQMEREKDIEERRKRRERDRERDRDRNRDREKRDRSPQGFSRKPADSDEEEDDERDKQKRKSAGACFAPPSSLINEDAQPTEEDLKPPMLPPAPSTSRPKNFGDIIKKNKSSQEDLHPERSTTPPPGSEFEDPDLLLSLSPNAAKLQNFQPPVGLGAASVAAKIMAKYGFKEGRGLGKSEQGISTALSVEKTSKRGGKIIDASKSEPLPQFPLPNIPRQQTSNMPSLLKNPTKVVLLMNMVGPGEVDEDLEPETAEECSKYGPVTKVVIYEEPEKVEEEAVRIFVEFARMESAIKAVVDLNGRYFGGRVVKASFYSVEKYKGYQLND